jgi:predicted enzyme related to lactoylglutathione lyase
MTHPVLHFEVSGKNLDSLQTFYGELFGWKTQKIPGDMPYAMVEKEDGGIGGGIGQSPDGNGHVTFYVGTDDPQATLDKAEQLGGKTILPVTELPEVTIALFADPEGTWSGSPKACSCTHVGRLATGYDKREAANASAADAVVIPSVSARV